MVTWKSLVVAVSFLSSTVTASSTCSSLKNTYQESCCGEDEETVLENHHVISSMYVQGQFTDDTITNADTSILLTTDPDVENEHGLRNRISMDLGAEGSILIDTDAETHFRFDVNGDLTTTGAAKGALPDGLFSKILSELHDWTSSPNLEATRTIGGEAGGTTWSLNLSLIHI